MLGCRLDSSSSGQGFVPDSFEHGTELSVSLFYPEDDRSRFPKDRNLDTIMRIENLN
jgi:hypothetical protein